MKYIVLVPDGMADYPLEELEGKTPLEAAKTPNMDTLATLGRVGQSKTVPAQFKPGSDVAIMSLLGYDPAEYYTGRGPLEAVNLGVELKTGQLAFRCNLVTVENDTMVDYSAGHVSSKEADAIISFLDKKLGAEYEIKFYPGVSYRHLMVLGAKARAGAEGSAGSKELLPQNIDWDKIKCTPPHDIMGKNFLKYLPQGNGSDFLIKLMEDSRHLLNAHDINKVRIDLGENPANMIWLWGQGKAPQMPAFKEKYGVEGTVISAVDLIKGLGRIIGLKAPDVPGATGYYDTNYEGKIEYALDSLKESDFVFVHVEATDEAGHNGDLRAKISAIEKFDSVIVGQTLSYIDKNPETRVLLLPDHPTPVKERTHTSEAVPFILQGKDIVADAVETFSEKNALENRWLIDKGYMLLDQLFNPDAASQ